MPTLNRRKEISAPRQGRNNRAFYQSYHWHEYSRQYRKNHRLCVMCLEEGISKISECVDHIIPMEQGGDPWNPDNHQALCISHHNQKTKTERKV